MFCPNCGKLMNDGDSFCGNCGTQFPNTNPIPDPVSAPNQKVYYKPTNLNSISDKIKNYFISMKTPKGLDIPKILTFSVACAQLLAFIFFLCGGLSYGYDSITFLGIFSEAGMGSTVFFSIVLLLVPLAASVLKLFKLFMSDLAYDIISLAVNPIHLTIVFIINSMTGSVSHGVGFNFAAVMYIIFSIFSVGVAIFNVITALKNIKK